jgi:hypothetical protein
MRVKAPSFGSTSLLSEVMAINIIAGCSNVRKDGVTTQQQSQIREGPGFPTNNPCDNP